MSAGADASAVIGNPLGGSWGKTWRAVRQSLPVTSKEGQAAFECMLEVCKRRTLTMMQVDAMTVWEFAHQIYELRLTDKAPERLKLPLEPLPPLIPEPGPSPTMNLGGAALLHLMAFNDKESLPETDDAILWALEERGFMRNDKDEFGDLWSITTAGRAHVREVRAAQPGYVAPEETDAGDEEDDFDYWSRRDSETAQDAQV